MDDWGDPWADDATKGINSQEVSQKVGKTAALGSLPSWQDDAQWGDEGNSGDWGDFQDSWVQKKEEDVVNAGEEDTEASGTILPDIKESEPAYNGAENRSLRESASLDEHTGSKNTSISLASQTQVLAYGQYEVDASEGLDAATDSSSDTIVQAGESAAQESVDAREENASTRHSTTTSDATTRSPSISHETPRTSSEDERADTNVLSSQIIDAKETSKATGDASSNAESERADADNGKRQNAATVIKSDGDTLSEQEDDNDESHPAETAPRLVASIAFARPNSDSFRSNQDLLKELLPPAATEGQFEDCDDNVLSSTSAKKAWYRLTRKGTLREFNAGSADDNYIRVTWARSQVRTDVNKIVSRWMIEDRATGKASFGNRPSAMFGWDQPVDKDAAKAGFFRNGSFRKPALQVNATRTSAESTRATISKSPGVATSSFGWSSASAWAEPSNANDAPTEDAKPVEAASRASNPMVAKLAGEAIRPMSADFSTSTFQFGHKKNTQSVSKLAAPDDRPSIDALMHNAAQKNLGISPMVPNAVEVGRSTSRRSSARPSDITVPPPHDRSADNSVTANAHAGIDNDDDWGEMVQSPALAPPPTAKRLSSPLIANETASADATPLSTAHDKWARASPAQPVHTESYVTTNTAFATDLTHTHVATEQSSTQENFWQAPQTPIDPWASADFSAFESPPAQNDGQPPSSPLRSTSPMSSEPRPPLSTIMRQDGAQNDGIVTSLLQELPDLSYMLL